MTHHHLTGRDRPLFVAVIVLLFMASVPARGGERCPDETWHRYATIEEAGFSAEKLEEAKQYWASIPSAAVMVVHDGAVVAAWGDVERRFMLHSVRKSLMSGLYGLYAETDRLDLQRTLEQLGIDDEHPPLTTEEKQARIIDLLSARSGVYHTAAAEPPGNPKPEPGSHPPGTHWCYNNWDFNVLGTIFNQELDVDLFEEFARRFADPLGMQDFRLRDGHYELAPQLSTHPAYVMRSSARDMARYGLLYLRKGRWDSTQILSEQWVAQSTTAHSYSPSGVGYGYMWWVPQQEPFKSVGMFSARGVGEQSIDVMPGANLVVVHRCDTYNRQNVTREQRLELLKLILQARVSKPRPDATLVPLEPVEKTFTPLELSDQQKHALCGEVKLEPFGDTVTLRVDEGALVLEGPLGVFGLIPVAEDRFLLEDVRWACIVQRDDAGAVTNLVLQP